MICRRILSSPVPHRMLTLFGMENVRSYPPTVFGPTFLFCDWLSNGLPFSGFLNWLYSRATCSLEAIWPGVIPICPHPFPSQTPGLFPGCV